VKYKKVAALPALHMKCHYKVRGRYRSVYRKFTPFTLTWLCRKRPVVFDSGGKFTEPPFCQHEHLIRINIACNTENGIGRGVEPVVELPGRERVSLLNV